jgi:hypothetical protein
MVPLATARYGVSATETYQSLDIEPKPLRPHILAAATVVYGDDFYSGRRETISLSGYVQLNKWPMPGFAHRVDEQGHAEFELELISAPEVGIKGFSYFLDDRIQILSNPYLPNTGHVRQIVPGQNFPAEFYIRRFGVLETSTMRLAHRDVIDIKGVVDGIPPYKKPLTSPMLGAPRGDGPAAVVPAPNVVRGTNLPEAWYPATDRNEPIGLTPTVFFAESIGPCMSMLVDPSLIIQSTMAGRISLDFDGATEQVELAGDHKLAAGAEILVFEPEKHGDGDGVLAQLARLALVGECDALGGRVMVRVSFFKPSGGTLGEGWETSVDALRFPSELHLDAQLEIVTQGGVLYAASPTHVSGTLPDVEVTGTKLTKDGGDVALVTADGEFAAWLKAIDLRLGEGQVGHEAHITPTPALAG